MEGKKDEYLGIKVACFFDEPDTKGSSVILGENKVRIGVLPKD